MGVTTEQVMALISKSHKPDHETAVELLELARSAGLPGRIVRPLAAYVAGLPQELGLKGQLDRLRGDNAALWGETKGAASDPLGGEQLDIEVEASAKDEGGRMKDEVSSGSSWRLLKQWPLETVKEFFAEGGRAIERKIKDRELNRRRAWAMLSMFFLVRSTTLPMDRGSLPKYLGFPGNLKSLDELARRLWLYELEFDGLQFYDWEAVMEGASDRDRRLVAEGLLSLMPFDGRGVLMDDEQWDSLSDQEVVELERFVNLPGMMGGMPWERV